MYIHIRVYKYVHAYIHSLVTRNREFHLTKIHRTTLCGLCEKMLSAQWLCLYCHAMIMWFVTPHVVTLHICDVSINMWLHHWVTSGLLSWLHIFRHSACCDSIGMISWLHDSYYWVTSWLFMPWLHMYAVTPIIYMMWWLRDSCMTLWLLILWLYIYVISWLHYGVTSLYGVISWLHICRHSACRDSIYMILWLHDSHYWVTSWLFMSWLHLYVLVSHTCDIMSSWLYLYVLAPHTYDIMSSWLYLYVLSPRTCDIMSSWLHLYVLSPHT